MILQLVDEQRLSLDDTLVAILPDPPSANVPHAEAITISMLLDHTSGARSFTDVDAFWDEAYGLRGLDRTWRPEELIEYSLDMQAYFEPGAPSLRHYSNTNYVLLGMVIEKATKQSLAENIRSRILLPLGLTSTSLEGFEPGMDRVQHSFHKASFGERLLARRRGWIKAEQKHVYDLGASYKQYNSWAWAAGGLASNTTDLLRFLEALSDTTLLSSENRNLLFKINSAKGSSGTTFGGSGGWDGITASAFDINSEIKVVVLANGTGFGVSANDLVSQLIQVYKDEG